MSDKGITWFSRHRLPIHRVCSHSKLEAAYRLHKAGIRHYELDKKESFITGGGRVYIMGFSKAQSRCGCEMSNARVKLCQELMQMELELGDGGTNKVLEEVGAPRGWREYLMGGATTIARGKHQQTAVRRCAT